MEGNASCCHQIAATEASVGVRSRLRALAADALLRASDRIEQQFVPRRYEPSIRPWSWFTTNGPF